MLLTCLVTAGCASGLSTGSVVRASLPQGAECRCDRVEHFELGPFTLALEEHPEEAASRVRAAAR